MKHEQNGSSHTVTAECECATCKGTGLYSGCAERNGFAIQCYKCKGSGKSSISVSWNDFLGRVTRDPVPLTVLQHNPGIVVGIRDGQWMDRFEFGGLPYGDWLMGLPFGPGTEMRKHCCPAWWYQSVDYDKKPNWDKCGFGTFSSCDHFKDKAACWEQWDKEQDDEVPGV